MPSVGYWTMWIVELHERLGKSRAAFARSGNPAERRRSRDLRRKLAWAEARRDAARAKVPPHAH